ncbi:MAG: nuclear transport factor 2 family protein [Thermoleophilia bacterium]
MRAPRAPRSSRSRTRTGPSDEPLARAPQAGAGRVLRRRRREGHGGSVVVFADDATFTIQTVPVTLTGKAEIRGMFEHFFGDYSHIEHNITNLVVDEAEGRASTEQSCPHIKTDGTLDHAITCNFFSFNEDGKFTRVIVWIDVASPLRK